MGEQYQVGAVDHGKEAQREKRQKAFLEISRSARRPSSSLAQL
jgi:hypothetical protein